MWIFFSPLGVKAQPQWTNADGTLNIQKLLESFKPQQQNQGLNPEFFDETLDSKRRPYRERSYRAVYDSLSDQHSNELLTELLKKPNSNQEVREFLFQKYYLPIEKMIETRWITLDNAQLELFKQAARNPHMITVALLEAEAERMLNNQRFHTLTVEQSEIAFKMGQTLRSQDLQTYHLLKNVIAEQISKLSFSDYNGTYFKEQKVQHLQMPGLNALALIEKSKSQFGFIGQLTDLQKACGSVF